MLISRFVFVQWVCYSWFLFPLWFLGEHDCCMLPGRKFSLDLIGVASVPDKMCFCVLGIDTGRG